MFWEVNTSLAYIVTYNLYLYLHLSVLLPFLSIYIWKVILSNHPPTPKALTHALIKSYYAASSKHWIVFLVNYLHGQYDVSGSMSSPWTFLNPYFYITSLLDKQVLDTSLYLTFSIVSITPKNIDFVSSISLSAPRVIHRGHVT